MEESKPEVVDASSYEKRLTNEWIHENIFKRTGTPPDYLEDYSLLGEAWLKLHEHFKGRKEHHVVANDGVYQVDHIDVLYSGHAYNYQLQLIWCVDLDCKWHNLPQTVMTCIYATIVHDILEDQS